MKTADFDYHLPPELIAQTPLERRDDSRLMVVSRGTGSLEHRRFYELDDCLQPGDVLVYNDSRVIPARLLGQRAGSGGKVELLLLRRLDRGVWETLAKPARRLKEGAVILVGSEPHIQARVTAKTDTGTIIVELAGEDALEEAGIVPLPPYIRAPLHDKARYQTVYASREGSVAAPTAGLHFTPELMSRLRTRDVRLVFVTLHLALDSFRPVRTDSLQDHAMHSEYCELGQDVSDTLNLAKIEGRRVICVGTSAVRAVETAACAGGGTLAPFSGWTDLFVRPGHRFQAVDAMITNFHLPRSTHLMLVSAFASRDLVLRSYEEAIQAGYRFYSFGDAMLIV